MFGGARHGPRTNPLDFGGDADHDPHPGIFKLYFSIVIPTDKR